jgi:hypothetical protein
MAAVILPSPVAPPVGPLPVVSIPAIDAFLSQLQERETLRRLRLARDEGKDEFKSDHGRRGRMPISEIKDIEGYTALIKYLIHWCGHAKRKEEEPAVNGIKGIVRPEGEPYEFALAALHLVEYLEKRQITDRHGTPFDAPVLSDRDIVTYWLTCRSHHLHASVSVAATLFEAVWLVFIYGLTLKNPDKVTVSLCHGSNIVRAMAKYRNEWIRGPRRRGCIEADRLDAVLCDMAAFTVYQAQQPISSLMAKSGDMYDKETKRLTKESTATSLSADDTARIINEAINRVNTNISSTHKKWVACSSIYGISMMVVKYFHDHGATLGPPMPLPPEILTNSIFMRMKAGVDRIIMAGLEQSIKDQTNRQITHDLIYELNLPFGAAYDQQRNADCGRLDYPRLYKDYIGVTEAHAMLARLNVGSITQWYHPHVPGGVAELESQTMTNTAIELSLYRQMMNAAIDKCQWESWSLITPSQFRERYQVLTERSRDGRHRTPIVVLLDGRTYVHCWIQSGKESITWLAKDIREAITIWNFFMYEYHPEGMENALLIKKRWHDDVLLKP